jgi:hypothetical protein
VLAGVFIGIGSYLAGFIGGAIEEGFASCAPFSRG